MFRTVTPRSLITRRAANVVGLPEDVLDEWAASGFFVPADYDEDREPRRTLYTVVEMVALIAIRQLIQAGVSQAQLPDMHALLAQLPSETSLPGHILSFDGSRALLRAAGDTAHRDGHRALELELELDLGAILQEVNAGINTLGVRNASDYGRITIDPSVWEGQPVIAGTRIPVFVIVDLVHSGLPMQRILWEYPQLRLEDLEAALKHEQSLSPTARQAS